MKRQSPEIIEFNLTHCIDQRYSVLAVTHHFSFSAKATEQYNFTNNVAN